MNKIDPALLEAMKAIEPVIEKVTEDHEAKQRLWMPAELIPEEHKFPELPPEITGMLVLNLLTENGLPYFLMMLVKHLGDQGAIWNWSRLWTAEEDRHGNVIQLYLQQSLNHKQLTEIERMQFSYLRDGFSPDWSNDPFRLLSYVVIQEKATQVSHKGIARHAASVDPVLQGIFGRISAEEKKHHEAYLAMFGALLEANPSHAVIALHDTVKDFAMPGASVKGFDQLTILQQRLNAFGPAQLAEIMKLVWDELEIGSLANLSPEAEKARVDMSKRSRRLEKLAERLSSKEKKVYLPFLGSDVTVTV